VAYSYAYSPVAGDAPIARTIILSGTILPGLTWNQATATLSGTATESGIMELTLRTIDTNGLYADLTDTIWMIGEVVWDSDTMTGGDALIIDDGIGFQGQSSAQGFVSANVTLNNGDWYWETTTGWYRQSDAFINEYGSGGIIQGSTNYYGLVIDRIGSTDDGGAVSSDPALFDTQVLYVGWFPPAATLRSERIRHRLTFDGGEATWQVAIGAGAWTEIMAGKDGPFTPYAMSRGTTNEISPSPEEIAKTVYIYSRPDQFDYDVPDGALPLQLAAPAA
jgi:hypothetical protein